MTTAATIRDRLYGLPGAEWLHSDLDDAIRAEFYDGWEPVESGESLIIEEWTIRPPEDHLPTAHYIVEWAIEHAADNDSVENQFDFEPTGHMVAAAEMLRQVIVEKVRVHSADRLVARHIVPVTLDADGEPSVNGAPVRHDLAAARVDDDADEIERARGAIAVALWTLIYDQEPGGRAALLEALDAVPRTDELELSDVEVQRNRERARAEQAEAREASYCEDNKTLRKRFAEENARAVQAEAKLTALSSFAAWLVALDDPDPACRRRVTLTAIIACAHDALADSRASVPS